MTKGTPISRRTLGALLGVPLAAATASAVDLWAALRSPGHVALIRHAVAPGTFDPPGFTLGDCASQRNLSTDGRRQASRMGDLLRRNGIAAAGVHSSQWCRCLDTATLFGLGDVMPQPLLNSFAEDRTRSAQQIAGLRAWIGAQPLAAPTLLVTHQVVISALSDASAGSGEIVVMRRDPDGQLILVGRQPTA
ncbi:histidine phosphatase family protein [soil metagenome]